MTIQQIATDISAVLGASSVFFGVLAHLPFPAKYAQFFARLAIYAANAKFSVNVREQPPSPPPAPKRVAYVPNNTLVIDDAPPDPPMAAIVG